MSRLLLAAILAMGGVRGDILAETRHACGATFAPSLTTQALAARAAGSDGYALEPPRRQPSISTLLSRRWFVFGAAAAASLQPALAINGGKPGVPGSIYTIPLSFEAYSPDKWTGAGEKAVLQFLADWMRFKMSHATLFSEPPFFPSIIDSALQTRSAMAEKLLAMPMLRQELTAILKQNSITGFSPVDSEERWNQLLFVALPAYAAQRGVLVHHTGLTQQSAEHRTLPIQESVLDNLGVYQVKQVFKKRAETLWGAPQICDEAVIGGPLPLDGVPSSLTEERSIGLTYGRNIFYFEPVMTENDRSVMSEIASGGRDPLFDGAQALTWANGMARPEVSIDAVRFARLKILGSLRRAAEVPNRISRWRVVFVRFHERMHLFDVPLFQKMALGRHANAQDELDAREAWGVTTEFRGYLSGARHSAETETDLSILDILNRIEDSNSTTREANLHLLSAMVDVIESAKRRNAQTYPAITLIPNHPRRGIREQIIGQLYLLRGAQARQVFDGVYARYVRNRAVPLPLLGPRVSVRDILNRSLAEPPTPTVRRTLRGLGEMAAGVLMRPKRVTETDLESLVDRTALDVMAFNREWDGLPQLPEDASLRLHDLRDRLHLAPRLYNTVTDRARIREIATLLHRLSPDFRNAQRANDSRKLAALNDAAQALIRERLELQFALIDYLIDRRNSSAALAAMIGLANTLDRWSIELYWQRARSYTTTKAKTLEARNWWGEAVATFALEDWGIREEAMGRVAIPQMRHVTRVIQGVTIERKEWRTIVYKSILEAFRSQIHTIDKQQEDLFTIIGHLAQLRYIEKLLDKPTTANREKALEHLKRIDAWAQRGRVEGKQYSAVEIGEALKAINDGNHSRAIDRLGSARKVLKESRVAEIQKMQKIVQRRAASLLDQIQKERLWADHVRAMRDQSPENARAPVYLTWLHDMADALRRTPYARPPGDVIRARERIAPTLNLLEKLNQRLDESVKEALRQAIRINVQAIRQDLRFLGAAA